MRVRRSNAGRAWRRSLLVALLLVAAACGKATTPPGSGGPPISVPGQKLAVLQAVGGHLAYCDPDIYPIARGNALEIARARFPTIKADHPVFDAILQHEDLSAGKRFTPDELIAINNDYKQMQAITLKPAGDGYAFDLQVVHDGISAAAKILHMTGTVSPAGAVTILQREAGHSFPCPVCLAAGVVIATPQGSVPVQELRVGMPVWTTDLRGHRIAGVVLETGHMEAPLGHEVVRLTLADGRTVVASPSHPTADGRTVGALELGDRYDGSVVEAARLIPYTGTTWDLLPSGPTATYFANGVLLGSTLQSSGGNALN